MTLKKNCLAIFATFCFLYTARNTITSASAYFLDNGIFSTRLYAVMQTVAFFLVFFSKFGSGFLATWITRQQSAGALRKLVLCFALLPLLTTLSLFSLGIIGTVMTKDQLFIHRNNTFLAFLFVYCSTKILASFARMFVIQIFHLLFQTKKSDVEKKENVFLAKTNVILQILSCVGDALGKFTFGSLLKNQGIIAVAGRSNKAPWGVPFCIMASMASLGVPSLLSMFRISQPTNAKESGLIKNNLAGSASLKQSTLELVRNKRFLLLIPISIINSFITVSSVNYLPHYLRFSLGYNSADVTRLDAITPVLIIGAILFGAYILNKNKEKEFRCLRAIVLPYCFNVLCMLTLCILSYIGSVGVHMPALMFTHHAIFFVTLCLVDGAFLMMCVSPTNASIAAGFISGVGYLGSLLVPFSIEKLTTRVDGWNFIIFILTVLECFVLILLISLSFADRSFVKRVA